jgi:LemA protein
VIPALIIVAAVGVWAVVVYNGLVKLRVLGDNAWSDIDVQLKRRHDLIPNVVEVVKGHAGYERGTLERVVEARTAAVGANAQGPEARGEAEGVLSQALGRLFALAESYPDLKAGASYRQLQQTLVEVEDAIQNARRYYNAVVRDFNTKIAVFPSNILAGMFNFKAREFFEISAPAEREVPKVSFGGTSSGTAGGTSGGTA